jgi:hypothetical protein
MEKLLEYARTVQITLVAICAAVIGLVSAGVGNHEPNDAVRALEQVKRLNPDLLAGLVHKGAEKVIEESGINIGIQQLAKRTGLPLSISHFYFDEIDEVITLKEKLKNDTLAGLQKYLSEAHPITMALPNKDEFIQILETQLQRQDYRKIIVDNAESFKLNFSTAVNRPELGWMFSLNWPDPDATQRSFNIGRFENLPAPRTTRVQIANLSIKGWINDQLLETDPFGPTKTFWPELKDQRLDAALLSLQLLAAHADDKFEILGLKVKAQFGLVVAPLACLCLMLYLLSQLIQIHALQLKGSQVDSNFPWFAFYPDRLSTALAYSSITAAPLAAVGFLLLQTFRTADLASWISLFVYAGMIMTSAGLVRTLYSARATLAITSAQRA